MYLHDITTALTAATPLILVWLFVYATYQTLRLFTRAAFGVTTALLAAFVIIGLLNS